MNLKSQKSTAAEGLSISVAHFFELKESAVSVIESVKLKSQKLTAAEGLSNSVARFFELKESAFSV